MYRKKTLYYGNRIEVRKYHLVSMNGPKGKREKRKKATPEQMKRTNEMQAVRKLKRLMIGNFDEGDWHITLTYSNKNRPDREGGKKTLKRFLDRLRVEYKKRGQQLKYIVVTEWRDKNIHHHMVINDTKGIGVLIGELWCGGKHFTPLYKDKNFEKLAEYFVKETEKTFRAPSNPWKQRYTCSRNLKKPVEKTEVVRANSWREDIMVPKSFAEQGYVLDKSSVCVGFDGLGYPFQEYCFIRYGRRC